MSDIILKLSDICEDQISTRAEGHVLFDRISEAMSHDHRVIVDFEKRVIASESFLDEAIVEHFLNPTAVANISERLILRSVSSFDQQLLNRIYAYRKKLEEKMQRRAGKSVR